MDYKINGQIYEADEIEVKSNMTEFKISHDDAVRMYFEDLGLVEAGGKTAITPIKTSKTKRAYVKSDKPRKVSSRERKIDETKKGLLAGFRIYIEGKGGIVTSIKNEVEVNFTFGDDDYTLKLTKHRKSKK